MSIYLEIPDTVVEALRVPPQQRKQQLLVELSVSLYAQSILSFGKARELANMEKRDFAKLLGSRAIPRHYTPEDLEDDIAYVHSE